MQKAFGFSSAAKEKVQKKPQKQLPPYFIRFQLYLQGKNVPCEIERNLFDVKT